MWNLVEIRFALDFYLTVQSNQKFAHATASQLSWHVRNCDWIW